MFKPKMQCLFTALLLVLVVLPGQSKEVETAEGTEIPINIWQRDLMVAEELGTLSKTLKCLMHIYDTKISEQIYKAFDKNMESAQKETIVKLKDIEFMDIVHQKLMAMLNKLQSLHSQCASIPYPCVHPDHSQQTKVPRDLQDLQKNMEDISVIMKCILSGGYSDTRIYSVIAKAFVRFHGRHEDSMTSADVATAESSLILTDLKRLDSKCQTISYAEEPCFLVQTDSKSLQKSHTSNTLTRDLLAAEKLIQTGDTLKCLMHIFDAEIEGKIYQTWDGNLERVQKEAILKLTGDQFMDLLNEKVMVTLREVQTIHPQCATIPYPWVHHSDSRVNKVPTDIHNLQKNLEDIGVTIKCLLRNERVDPRIHNIFAKAFERYHGSHDDSLTSLAVTEVETAHLLSDLRKLDERCQMVRIKDESCTSSSSIFRNKCII